MTKNEAYSRICEAAGIDLVREHYGLPAAGKVALDVGGFELWIKIKQAAIDLLRSLGGKIDDATYAAIKAAMNDALAKAWEVIDFPGPDFAWEKGLTVLANWALDKARQAISNGS